jgi:hypothetical protein
MHRQFMGSLTRRSNRGTDDEVSSAYDIPIDISNRHAPLSEGTAFECRYSSGVYREAPRACAPENVLDFPLIPLTCARIVHPSPRFRRLSPSIVRSCELSKSLTHDAKT